MNVSDYLLNRLVSLGTKEAFLITGSAIAWFVDSFYKRKDIKYICVAHEQTGAMAAEAYSRIGPGIGVAIGTSGPGATNLITGICCAWFDSIPVLYITGQVNRKELKGESKVRQVGFQETDIVSIVKSITKFAVRIDNPDDTRYLFEKAIYLAKSGRPGPVLIDLPMDIQREEINPKNQKSFVPAQQKPFKDTGVKLSAKVEKSLRLIEKAKRPIILIGGGIRIAHVEKEVKRLIEVLGFPVVKTWGAFDILPSDYSLLIGTPGVYGNRGANFAVQNADLLITLGSRLDTRLTGGKPATFAREAKKIVVDIDKAELDKRRGLTPDLAINSDLKEFLGVMLKHLGKLKKPEVSNWLKKCQVWKKKYPIVLPEYFKEKKDVNAYAFIKTLSEELDSRAVIIPDEGGNLTWTIQAFKLKEGQRLFSALGNSPMGYSFPAAIGASFALGKKEIICIDGDGGFQINIQDLETVVHHKLPIKIFIINNRGYGIIQQFQETWCAGRYAASTEDSGYSVPDFVKIAKAYGLETVSIKNHREMRRKIREVLRYKGPVLCDVRINKKQRLIPKLEFGRPLEEISPLLDRKEFIKEMIIKPLE